MELTHNDLITGIHWYIRYKFFDAAHPENHTLRMSSDSDRHIQYYDGTEWKSDFCTKVAPRIMHAFEAELIALFQSSDRRDNYFLPDGDQRHRMLAIMTRIGFPFRFHALASLAAINLAACVSATSDEHQRIRADVARFIVACVRAAKPPFDAFVVSETQDTR